MTNSFQQSFSHLAYRALERDSMNNVEGADEAMGRYLNNNMDLVELKWWADKEREWNNLKEEDKR